MKYLVLLLVLGGSTMSMQAQSLKTNEQSVAAMKAAGYSGHFFYKIADNKSVNVNYSFTPLEPATTIDFTLHTPAPRPLWFQITNTEGKVVAEWKPEQPKYFHKGQLDISDLKPGKYIYKIYWDKALAYSIPFKKK